MSVQPLDKAKTCEFGVTDNQGDVCVPTGHCSPHQVLDHGVTFVLTSTIVSM